MLDFFRSKCIESWLDFLGGFRKRVLKNFDTTEREREDFDHLTIVSDRAKGLIPAVVKVLPKAFHYHYTQHLAENVKQEFGRKVEKISKTKTKLWEARGLPILHSLHHIRTYVMSKFYERRHNPQKDENYTNYAIAYFRKELEESSQYLVTPQERENIVAIAYRTNPEDRETRLVQLKAQKCSCLAFQDHKIPCRHAIAVYRFFNAKPENYIAKFYEISEYREQYKYSLLPILLDDLEPDGVTKPPPDAPSRGRPVQKRMKRRTRETGPEAWKYSIIKRLEVATGQSAKPVLIRRNISPTTPRYV
ncbi:hypothetical protein BS50DRAFT_641103 [Corynespora cassiicola Philippines]|uniref:SWIM-type domain-containing protein n=1 Tax=Corynespora cassiicola Philippines TaxID=1448308 RepID=A0A2T2N1F1_CORCC|nr:hypothetical protein BS50DRAFT_641103 [Corynespora cassiicola Philippines]